MLGGPLPKKDWEEEYAQRLRPDQVGVKATTNERLGFPGREEGMAAMAVCAADV